MPDPTPERVREIADYCYTAAEHPDDLGEFKLTEIHALARQVIALREDLERAAGDFPVPMPEPGTDMAVLLSANVLLRRENATLREIARDAIAEIENVERGYDANSESPPPEYVPGGPLLALRARLDALGGG
jgi:hypothetical protein